MTEHDTRREGPSPRDTMVDATDTTLTAKDFVQFFRDIHGHDPFPWQSRLTSHVIDRQAWPKVMDLPTGSGKTAVLDTALFALAARPDIFSRRIVFVIDRRIVVDQVYKRAEKIQRRIREADTPILAMVRSRLSELCDEPLGVAALRGGVPIDGDWVGRPDQPWVVVSTVDQFGSRLLFRGYGTNKRNRPIHAGLTGNDSLVILDEVHLSTAFSETLAAVRNLAASPLDSLPRRFQVVEMSATPRDTKAERFTLDPATDLDGCAELRRRIQAEKSAELVSVPNLDSIPARILKIVHKVLKSDESVCSLGVVVNRVRTARETHQALRDVGIDSHLITGRMRPLDREDVIKRIVPAIDPSGERLAGGLTIVVATQAIEVGADFSFDALITECAAVDSLRQRFGRLDRRGSRFARTGAAARAWIIGPRSVLTSKKPDPIYGDATKVTWQQLKQRAEAGALDVGPTSLSGFPEAATAQKACAPLLLKTHLDAWVQTNPEPIVQPAVDWFLHGIPKDRTPTPDVSIVWRRDRSREVLRLVPPRTAEALKVPIDAVKAWLSHAEEPEVADVVQQAGTSGSSSRERRITNCDRWEGFDKEPQPVTQTSEIRPGNLLIVSTSCGGLVDGTWGPASTESVTDLGDAAQVAHRHRATLRLDPRLHSASDVPLPSDETDAQHPARDRIAELLSRWQSQPEGQHPRILEAIKRLTGESDPTPFEITAVGINAERTSDGYYILSERKRKPAIDPGTMDGSDEAGSLTGTEVSLDRHLQGVARRVRCWAERLGFSSELADDLHLAGLLHDIGKVDQRFQFILVGRDPIKLEMLEAPIAKSSPGTPQTMDGQQRGSWSNLYRRYPKGMRHELASVALAESTPEVLGLAHDGDLVLHLIGTHHGWGRPLPPVIEDREPESLTYHFDGNSLEASSQLADGPLALEMADRFWRLVARYGYYGLAWLEATFRLADHRQSASEAD